ncbi:RNA polymerase sigma-70 factor, ECF subfamily [Evansella caseinilytica]|uniref:RNA polymerase sigma factor n=1 Tax=Evansella caseinilytica TaxID=1503961 RepID=A0A1H3RB39_9BACI|nr:RNA polymerase sigma factor [Evansella caseinilytica]SDZ22545.1 RNA polymerase sigma-70 factor, ECF subfamily [Evansella caseinilytica]
MSEHKQTQVSKWFQQYGVMIHAYIYKMIGDHHEAEDLTQETFIKAYTFFDSYEQKASPKTWLNRIAHNVTIDHLRKRRPVLFHEEDDLEKTCDLSPQPSEIIKKNEDKERLYSALLHLKPAYRNVIVVRRLKECSIKETCEKLSWSEGKVKSTLPRAISRLEKQLVKEGFEYEQIG